MNAITHTESNALALSGASSTGLVLSNDTMDKAFRMAELMASGRATVPKHLQGSVADCMAVTLQALQWNMSPFAVAQKTHLVNGTLGYEAQLVNAVLQSTGAIVGEFEYEYDGEGDRMRCRVGAIPRGKKTVVWGEWLGVNTVTTKNSPLWKTNPKQQIGYLQVKNWARMYKPGAILGVYTADELADHTPTEKHMGAADVVAPPPATYNEEKFNANFAKWAETIQAGRKTAADYIQFAESRKEPFTEEQKARLLSVKKAPASQTDVQDVQPKGPPATAPNEGAPAVTYADVAAQLHAAQTLDALDDAASLIGAVASDQHQQELGAIYDERAQALGGE